MTDVRDNPNTNRYEIHEDEELAGFSEYKLSPGRIAFTHTEVDPAFNGRGLARVLVIASSPELYLDLVPARDRERFKLPVTDTGATR